MKRSQKSVLSSWFSFFRVNSIFFRSAMKRSLGYMVFCLLAGQCFAQTIAVKTGRLIDHDAGTVLFDQVILIHGNKIEAVGKGLAIPAGANVIDLSGKTVLPGLIDCHTHLADVRNENDTDPFLNLKKTAAQVAFESVPNPRRFLMTGFTTVRDVGVYRALNDIAMRDAINHGFIVGPRMFVAGAYVTITGGAGAM